MYISRGGTPVLRLVVLILSAILLATPARGQDWNAIQKEAIAILQQYLRIDTSNPPGSTAKAADFLSAILKKEGLPVTRYESKPGHVIIHSRLKGTGPAKSILLLNHMDVVPADKSRWKVDPFGGTIIGNEIWGRGAADMKGIGVVQLAAFLALKRHQVPLARDVIFMAVPDEETGGTLGALWMIQNHYAELDPEYVLDEGGFGSRDLFADGKLVFGISVLEKQIMRIRIRAEGVAGHGSQPHDRNPNDRLVRALARLVSQPLPTGDVEVLNVMRKRVGTFAKNKFTNAIQHSTIALTVLRAGVGEPPAPNVIPSIAEATIDCRVLPGTTIEQWVEEIGRRLGDPELKLEVINKPRAPESITSSYDAPLFKAIEAAIKRQYADAIVTPMLIPYGTDSNAFRPRGVKSYGVNPLILPFSVVSSMHSDEERLPLGDLGAGIRIMFEALKETASK
jgi:acetylornithine deacetylase/succinyl-diaminopimelate desuccinylase-like protein